MPSELPPEIPRPEPGPLVEGRDFVWENGLMVMTAEYLLRRGYCCENGCRHCPYPDPATSRPPNSAGPRG